MVETRILVIGDTHGARDALETVVSKVSDVDWDGVLMVGDLAGSSKKQHPALSEVEQELQFALECLGTLGAPVFWVPGNHDPRELDGPGSLDRRSGQIGDLSIFGIGGAGPARFGFPYEWDEQEIAELEVEDHDLLLSHAPPRGARDRVLWGRRVGSRSIRDLATSRFRVTICGHIHEAAGVQRLGDRLVLNAGSLGPPFANLQFGELWSTRGEIFARHVNLRTGKEQELGETRPVC